MPWSVAMHYGSINQVKERIARFKLRLDLYRPVVHVPELQEDGRVIFSGSEPLLFNYMFVKGKTASVKLADVPDILPIRWVLFNGKIQVVSDSVIQALRVQTRRLSQAACQRAIGVESRTLTSGMTVLVKSGAFDGVYGTVIKSGSGGTAIIEISCFGQATPCRINLNDISTVKTNTASVS